MVIITSSIMSLSLTHINIFLFHDIHYVSMWLIFSFIYHKEDLERLCLFKQGQLIEFIFPIRRDYFAIFRLISIWWRNLLLINVLIILAIIINLNWEFNHRFFRGSYNIIRGDYAVFTNPNLNSLFYFKQNLKFLSNCL